MRADCAVPAAKTMLESGRRWRAMFCCHWSPEMRGSCRIRRSCTAALLIAAVAASPLVAVERSGSQVCPGCCSAQRAAAAVPVRGRSCCQSRPAPLRSAVAPCDRCVAHTSRSCGNAACRCGRPTTPPAVPAEIARWLLQPVDLSAVVAMPLAKWPAVAAQPPRPTSLLATWGGSCSSQSLLCRWLT
jgi:hypothetical protein